MDTGSGWMHVGWDGWMQVWDEWRQGRYGWTWGGVDGDGVGWMDGSGWMEAR